MDASANGDFKSWAKVSTGQYKENAAGDVFSEGFPLGTKGPNGVPCVGLVGCQFKSIKEAMDFCDHVESCKGVVKHPAVAQ
jgi:hypothetical protein